jgi:uncharacterized protein (DUF58 family)
MSPTPRAALLLVLIALGALALPGAVVAALAVAVVVLVFVDAVLARQLPQLRRSLPPILARGVPATLSVDVGGPRPRSVVVRQPRVPDVTIEPTVARGHLEAQIVARRRGRHPFADVAARRTGPLGLGTWQFASTGRNDVLVYPDVPAAQRLALAVRRGRFRDPGRTRGPLGLGTEFESIRDYQPDDDIRQVNWTATARLGRPMSNQHRVEQDRDVVCVIDSGRLMAAPVSTADPTLDATVVPLDPWKTHLDCAVDAVTAIAYVADDLGDRCGVIAFDRELRRVVAPGRRHAQGIVSAIFDLEPRPVDADYELAFRSVPNAKRALVVVFTDLLDETAARSLLASLPVLARRHAVAVASVVDPALDEVLASAPVSTPDVFRTAAAIDVQSARARVTTSLRRAGVDVIEARPGAFSAACVRAYLRAKASGRL